MNLIVVGLCAVMLFVGVMLAVIRATKGPTALDRAVAMDVIMTGFIGAAALYIAMTRQTEVVPILVALGMVGFLGSVTVARFAVAEKVSERRIASELEIRRQEEAERARLLAQDEQDRRVAIAEQERDEAEEQARIALEEAERAAAEAARAAEEAERAAVAAKLAEDMARAQTEELTILEQELEAGDSLDSTADYAKVDVDAETEAKEQP